MSIIESIHRFFIERGKDGPYIWPRVALALGDAGVAKARTKAANHNTSTERGRKASVKRWDVKRRIRILRSQGPLPLPG